MLNEIDNLAKAMDRRVTKAGNKYYICSTNTQIRLIQCSNLKQVVKHLASTLDVLTVTWPLSDTTLVPDEATDKMIEDRSNNAEFH